MPGGSRVAPLWMRGLANATFGFYGGFISISLPQLLAAQHLSETTIATVTATLLSPAFWSFLFSPILDVHFSRQWYAAVTAAVSASMLFVAILFLHDLAVLQAALLVGFVCANLSQSALGGWLSSVTASADENRLSAWLTIGNSAGGGLMAAVGAEIVRYLPVPLAALSLGTLILLPTAIFLFIPPGDSDRRLVGESFTRFFADILAVLRRREVIIALLLFVAPAGTFALTGLLSGLGDDFNAPPRFVSLVGGAGVIAASIVGALIFPFFTRFLPLRPLYVAIATVGGIFTLLLLTVPRTPGTFALALIGENIFQAFTITNSIAIVFKTIGRANPLAATTYSVVSSAFNIPLTYMLIIDGRAYSHYGVAGSYITDACFGIAASLVLALMLATLRVGRKPGAEACVASS